MQVVTTTTHLGVIQANNPEDATLSPKLQSHLAHLPDMCPRPPRPSAYPTRAWRTTSPGS